MRTILPFLFLLLFACAPSKIEILISDFEQTMGNTKIDLSLKIHELKKVGYILNQDSIDFYAGKIESLKRNFYPDANLDTITSEIVYKDIDRLIATFESGKDLDYVYYSRESREWRKLKNEFEINCIYYNKFDLKTDSIYVNKWLCTYTIKNPMLNNVEQTISKTYFIFPDESGILTAQ